MIDGSATLAQARKEYGDTAPPFESVEQCRRFVRACAVLINLIPLESETPEAKVRYQVGLYQKQLERAETWLAAHGAGSVPEAKTVVTRPDFRTFRG